MTLTAPCPSHQRHLSQLSAPSGGCDARRSASVAILPSSVPELLQGLGPTTVTQGSKGTGCADTPTEIGV